jgi:hypothetical protein
MKVLQNNLQMGFNVSIALLFLLVVSSCTAAPPNPKEELLKSLKDAGATNYHFAMKESDQQEISSLSNNVIRTHVKVGKDMTNLVLRYTRVTDKKLNTTTLYKTEIARSGAALTLLITNLSTHEVISKQTFPTPKPARRDAAGRVSFDTLDECLRDFDCTQRGTLQCEANRTCEPILAAITCCLSETECYSVHIIIKPTLLRCLVTELIPDFDGLVLSPG